MDRSMEKPLGSIIRTWGQANLTHFKGKGANIHIEHRTTALALLCDEAKRYGYTRCDLDSRIKAIVDFCLPQLKHKRKDTFLYHILVDYMEVTDIKFPDQPSSIDFDKTQEGLTVQLGLKRTLSPVKHDIVERTDRLLEDTDISAFKKVEVEESLSAAKLAPEARHEIKKEIEIARIEKQGEAAREKLKDMFILSPQEIEDQFMPDLDPAVKEFLGLNDKGELE